MIIGNGIKKIGGYAFESCHKLKKVIIRDIAAWCEIEFGDRQANPAYISHHIYSDENNEITNLYIPNGVTTISNFAFVGCDALTSLSIPNGVISIGQEAFYYCKSITSVTIPFTISSIGIRAFDNIDITTVVSRVENPFDIAGKTSQYRSFSLNTFNNASLYVPVGSIPKYKATNGWKDFLFIEEGNGPNGGSDATETKICATPTIRYQNGKLTFNSDTEGAICHSTIRDDDINSYDGNEIQLGITYNIRVYATKEGYQNSETVNATLCWIDVEPKTEGITDAMTQMAARAVMVKAEGGQLTVEGAEDNTNILIYSIDGVQVGTTTSRNGVASIMTAIAKDSVAIVKIGYKSVKVMI